MKKLKPLLQQSENGIFQFKATDKTTTIIQRSNVDDVVKYNIVLVDEDSNEISDSDFVLIDGKCEIWNSNFYNTIAPTGVFKIIASTNIEDNLYRLSETIVNKLLDYHNKHNKFPEYLTAKQINIYGNLTYVTKPCLTGEPRGNMDFYEVIDVEIPDILTTDKIINVVEELSKTISNKKFGYIMLPTFNGFNLFKVETKRLEEYLAIESMRETKP